MRFARSAVPDAGWIVRSRGGFTLLEVMIAIMVLATCAVMFAGSAVVSQRAAHVNSQYSQAISLCQHKIDQLRAVGFGRLNYEELNDAGIIDDFPTTSPYSFLAADEVTQYLPDPSVCRVSVTNTADPSVMNVTVTVTWKNARHRAKTSSVSLSAQIANVE
jgi:prepilin-type N-terminal cleavage/methylation domain-containing protein